MGSKGLLPGRLFLMENTLKKHELFHPTKL